MNVNDSPVASRYQVELALGPALTDPAVVLCLEILQLPAWPNVLLLDLLLSDYPVSHPLARDHVCLGLRHDCPLLDDGPRALHPVEECFLALADRKIKRLLSRLRVLLESLQILNGYGLVCHEEAKGVD